MGVFIRLWGHYLLRNTQVFQVPMLWPSVLRDVAFLQVPGVGTACFIQIFARLSSRPAHPESRTTLPARGELATPTAMSHGQLL